jgi:hypothetical protein
VCGRAGGLQRPVPHVEENMGHWALEGHKKGEKPGHCASLGKQMLKTQKWQIHSRSCTSATRCASRDKMAYWCYSSNIFDSQLFAH